MNTKPWDTSGEARKALHGIVRDPQYGAAALSQPAVMTNLLKDLLPDEPREASLLVAAAQADLAGSLRGYVAQGLDPATAISLTATSFVNSSSHTPEAGNWVVSELALALGLQGPALGQPTAPPPTAVAAPIPGVPFAQQAQPVQPAQPIQPAQSAWPAAPNVAVNQPAAPTPYQPAAPNPWQPSPWTVPPRPASTGRGGSIVAGLVGLAGALFVLIGCLVPFEHYPGEPSFGILLGHYHYPVSVDFWYAAEPVGVLLVAVVAAIALMATGGSSRLRGLLPGMLLAFGFQTFLLFGGYLFSVLPSQDRRPGGAIGLFGGLILLAAGVIGLIAARKSAQSASTAGAMNAPGAPGAPNAMVPGPGPAGG